MKSYTCCYLEKDDKILMLYRNKKENDINKGKYIGVGGKVEENEDIISASIREVKEETNLDINSIKLRGLVIFIYDGIKEQIWISSSNDFSGNIHNCDEGDLIYVNKKDILSLNLWEGDKYFLKHILDGDEEFFIYQMEYIENKLIKVIPLQGGSLVEI